MIERNGQNPCNHSSPQNNPETTEIKYPADSCRLLRLDVVALILVCRQIGNCVFTVWRKNATKRSAGKYHRILKLKRN